MQRSRKDIQQRCEDAFDLSLSLPERVKLLQRIVKEDAPRLLALAEELDRYKEATLRVNARREFLREGTRIEHLYMSEIHCDLCGQTHWEQHSVALAA